jgi:1,2-diacylglycerol 3-alpha-glucosyltransferase
MRIAFITLFKEGCGGGEGRVAHEMAHHCAEWHEVSLICPGERTGLHWAAHNLQVFAVKSAGEGDLHVAALSGKQVKGIFDFLDAFRPDVVHAHEPLSLGLIGQVWAKMHNVPFVHTAHVLPSKMFHFGATEAITVLRSPIGETIAKQSLSSFFLNFHENCDAIFALNRFAAEDIRAFADCDRIFMIPNGLDLGKYSACPNTDTSSPKKTLTFIGYLSERKNQLYLLKALTHLPGYRLQLIGEPLKASYDRQLKDFAREHDLDVVFTGFVDHQEIPNYLAETHLLASASQMEVQSLVVIEALASGTPVVGLSNETIDEMVDEKVGIRLPKDADPREFARHVERICRLPQAKYDVLCENARERVRGHNWPNVIAETVKVYEALRRETPPTAEKSRLGLAKALSLIPRGEVKDFLAKQIASLEKTLQRTAQPRTESKFASRIKEARRVPNSTWILFALTIPISWIVYQVAKHLPITSRQEDIRGRQRSHRPKLPNWLKWPGDADSADADA